ncbi:hypothetical protein BKA80DRAFT_59868 [Phyllosticta citrichinensis]
MTFVGFPRPRPSTHQTPKATHSSCMPNPSHPFLVDRCLIALSTHDPHSRTCASTILPEHHGRQEHETLHPPGQGQLPHFSTYSIRITANMNNSRKIHFGPLTMLLRISRLLPSSRPQRRAARLAPMWASLSAGSLVRPNEGMHAHVINSVSSATSRPETYCQNLQHRTRKYRLLHVSTLLRGSVSWKQYRVDEHMGSIHAL